MFSVCMRVAHFTHDPLAAASFLSETETCPNNTSTHHSMVIRWIMAFCWIGSFANNLDSHCQKRWRMRIPVPPGIPGETEGSQLRLDIALPEPDLLPRWFVDKLKAHSLDPEGGSAPQQGLSIIGLARVGQGLCFEDRLTRFSPQATLQWDMYFQPLDAFVIHIEESWLLKTPIRVEYCVPQWRHERYIGPPLQVRRGKYQAFWPADGVPLSSVLISDSEERRRQCPTLTVGRVLASGGYTIDIVQGKTIQLPCLQVLSPLAELICKGAWKDLLWLARWPFPKDWIWSEVFPPRDWVSRVLAESKSPHLWDSQEQIGTFSKGSWEHSAEKFINLAADLQDSVVFNFVLAFVV